MRHIIILVLILSTTIVNAEKLYDDTPNGRVIKSGDFILNNAAYTWEAKILNDNTYKFKITKKDASKEFTLNTLNYEVFRLKFKETILSFDDTIKDSTQVFEEAAKAFVTIQINKEKVDEKEIIAGYLTVPKNPVKIYYYEDASRIDREKISTLKNSISVLLDQSKYLSDQIEKGNKYEKELKKDSSENPLRYKNQIPIVNRISDSLKNAYSSVSDYTKILTKQLENLYSNNSSNKGITKPLQVHTGDFYADSLTVEIFEGNLKNIIVYGEVKYLAVDYTGINPDQTKAASKKIILRNLYPIPFSSQRDLADLSVKLWEYPVVSDRVMNRFDKDWYAYCGDIVKYTYALAINQEDYSPKDQVSTYKPGENQPVFKEKTSKLFKVKVFSDFIGIKDDNPNGLVQFELSKRIILNPKRQPLIANFKRANYLIGTLNFIEPIFNLSKIEENNKYLPLSPIKKDTNFIKVGQPIKSSASILELYRYQNFSAGFNLNLVTLDLPLIKSSIYINGGLKLIRTAVSDSVRSWNKDGNIASSILVNKFNSNTFIYAVEANYQLKSDTRFGFQATFRTSWLNVLNNNIVPIYNPNLPEKLQYHNQRVISTAQLDAFIRPDISGENKGEIFARLSYNSLWFESKMNFMQVQIGYSFNLLKRE